MKHGSISQICDSPIEKHFLDGWLRNNLGAFTSRTDSETAKEWKARLRIDTPLASFDIYTQYRIGEYRVDFLCVSGGARVIVECDGHEFHERTKEQAANDSRRERALVIGGYSVLRYTGSELYRDAMRCAGEVQSYLEGQQ
jgi:very-short-patch-repair endonuclease